jgi:hypothetical protein
MIRAESKSFPSGQCLAHPILGILFVMPVARICQCVGMWFVINAAGHFAMNVQRLKKGIGFVRSVDEKPQSNFVGRLAY